MDSFWHTANLAFSKKERQAFNKWRLEMYFASEQVKDKANVLYLAPERVNDEVNVLWVNDMLSYVGESARAMHKKVCEIPVLEE